VLKIFNFNYFSNSVYFFVVIVYNVVQSLGLGFRLGLRTIEAISFSLYLRLGVTIAMDYKLTLNDLIE